MRQTDGRTDIQRATFNPLWAKHDTSLRMLIIFIHQRVVNEIPACSIEARSMTATWRGATLNSPQPWISPSQLPVKTIERAS